MVVSVYSNYESNYCDICSGVLSIFEFENKNGWNLGDYDIASIHVDEGTQIYFYPISPNNYGIFNTSSSGTMGELIYNTALYAFINKRVISVLEITHFGDAYSNYNVVLKKHERDNGYYDLLVEETVTKGEISDPFSDETEEVQNTTPIVTNTFYKFNGSKYEIFDGIITDPALTDMSRFIDINKINQRNNSNQSDQSDENNQKIREFLISHTFVNRELGGSTYLKFTSKSGGWYGAMTMGIGSCEYIYSYTLEGREINITFTGSTCGGQGSSQTMRINSDNSISASIKGQNFVFKPL